MYLQIPWSFVHSKVTKFEFKSRFELFLKILKTGLPQWLNLKESTCQCRRHCIGSVWSRIRKIPHTVGQLSPSTTPTEPTLSGVCKVGLRPVRPRSHALQQEIPPQWEACTPPPKSIPCLSQLQKSLCYKKEPAWSKINKS